MDSSLSDNYEVFTRISDDNNLLGYSDLSDYYTEINTKPSQDFGQASRNKIPSPAALLGNNLKWVPQDQDFHPTLRTTFWVEVENSNKPRQTVFHWTIMQWIQAQHSSRTRSGLRNIKDLSK